VNKNQNALFEISGEAEIVHNEKYDTDRLHIPIKLAFLIVQKQIQEQLVKH